MFPMEEELSSFQWFQLKLLTLDKYWSAFTDNCSVTAVGLIVASLVTALATWLMTRDTNDSVQPTMDEPCVDNRTFINDHLCRNIRPKSDDSISNSFRKRKGKLNIEPKLTT